MNPNHHPNHYNPNYSSQLHFNQPVPFFEDPNQLYPEPDPLYESDSRWISPWQPFQGYRAPDEELEFPQNPAGETSLTWWRSVALIDFGLRKKLQKTRFLQTAVMKLTETKNDNLNCLAYTMSDITLTEHPAAAKVRETLTKKVYFCSDVFPVTAESMVLHYRQGESEEARCINLFTAKPEQLAHLTSICGNATFGLGQQDVLDESYRKAKKLDTSSFFSGLERNDHVNEIVNKLTLTLIKQNDKVLRSELYKLNVYDQGSFFKAHKDTPWADNMVASLVIVFPTAHEGGSLILRHGGEEFVYDSAKELGSASTPSIGYVAFYSDVEHEVTPVSSGYRVTLTYNLYLEDDTTSPSRQISVPNSASQSFREALSTMLSDNTFLPNGGLIGFGLTHQYPVKDRFGDMDYRSCRPTPQNKEAVQKVLGILKGNDRMIYDTFKEFGLNAYLRVIYEDDGGLAMSEYIIDDECGNGYEESFLLSMCGGKQPIAELLRLPADYQDDEDYDISKHYGIPKPLTEVNWITENNTYNRLKVDYIAYGNEPSIAHVYGDFSLICEVGPVQNRKVL
ncbi:hypothetical protein D9758_005963 [Tetrapyrgos nigripes]|uniref:Prolyl 4-hydroxylase alpha subunit Fe(2+) 2OG dioxygenase domain-containing protein n=1 Tax=Tetrapyrgos nigripes TaxID=182062 RepID=A0A8H5G312_9AGAR|nr:hypothetical protein D9758_005963 [Tetrapyrgos nigripes]